jgi:membrane protein
MWQPIWEFLERWLYAPRADATGRLAQLRRGLRYPVAVLRDLSGGQLNLRAMSLVYTTLLAIIPAIALSFVVLRAFGLHRGLEPLILEFFRPVGAGAVRLTQRVMHFADNVRTGLVGSVGLATLLWTLIGTVKKVEDSFNFVWRVQQPRNFARRVAEYLGLLLAGPVVIVSVVGFSKLALDSANALALAQLPPLARVTELAIRLAPYAIVTTLFTALYLIIPNTRVRLVPAIIGAVAAGILWAAMGQLFTTMVVLSSRFTIIYAGFALLGALLLWTYLGWLILLAGAQLSFYLQNPDYLRLGLLPLNLTNQEKERLGLNVMYLVAHHQATGAPSWSIDALSHHLGVPGVAIAEVVAALERAKLLVEQEDGRVFPARDADSIRLIAILDAVRLQRHTHPFLHVRRLAPVQALQEQLHEAWRKSCGERSLQDLVDEAKP